MGHKPRQKWSYTYKDFITEDGLKTIRGLASDGLTNKEIAKSLGVNPGTFRNWVATHEKIREAVKQGRRPVVVDLEDMLIHTALGYQYEEKTIYDDGEVERTTTHIRYSQPNPSALIFLLKNYKPEKYRNYTEDSKRQIRAEADKLELEADKLKLEAEKIGVETDKLKKELEETLEEQGREIIIIDSVRKESDDEYIS